MALEYLKTPESDLSKEMILAIKRVENYVNDHEIEFHEEKAQKVIDFIQEQCYMANGENYKLAPVQIFILELLYGFYYKGERLIKDFAWITSRGSGKTAFIAMIATFEAIFGKSDWVLLAPSMRQSRLLQEDIVNMMNFKDSICKPLVQKGIIKLGKEQITNSVNRTTISNKALNLKTLDGLRANIIADEVGVYQSVQMLKKAADGGRKKLKNFRQIIITTNNTVRDGAYDALFEEWRLNLECEYETCDKSSLPLIYKLDDSDIISDESKWIKAIPMLNILTNPEVIRREVISAERNRDEMDLLRSTTFNLNAIDYLSFFNDDEVICNREMYDESIWKGTKQHKTRVVVGIDLSDTDDICSISVVTWNDGKFYVKMFNFIPRRRMNLVNQGRKEFYEKLEATESLILHDYDTNDTDYVFGYVNAWLQENDCWVIKASRDPWKSGYIGELFSKKYGSNVDYAYRQTFKNFDSPLKAMKSMINQQQLIADDATLGWCMRNTRIRRNVNMQIYPSKANSDDKIDAVFALLDAFGYVYWHPDEMRVYWEGFEKIE